MENNNAQKDNYNITFSNPSQNNATTNSTTKLRSDFILIVSLIECIFYLLYYFLSLISDSGHYESEMLTGYNAAYILLSLLRVINYSFILFVAVKVVFIIKKEFAKRIFKSFFTALIISLCNPISIQYLYNTSKQLLFIFFNYDLYNNNDEFIFRITSLITIVILLLLLYKLFQSFKQKEVENNEIARTDLSAWLLTLTSLASIALLLIASNYLIKFGIKQKNTDSYLSRIPNYQHLARLNNVSGDFAASTNSQQSNIMILFKFNNLPDNVKEGDRILILSSGKGYSNKYGDYIVDKSYGTGTIEKNNQIYYSNIIFNNNVRSIEKSRVSFYLDRSLTGSFQDRDAKRKMDLQNLANDFDAYKNINGKYYCKNNNTSDCFDQSEKPRNIIFPSFENKEYKDPINDSSLSHSYHYYSDMRSFIVYARLEEAAPAKESFFCIDNSINQKGIIVEKRPDPLRKPLSCNNLQTN